MNDRIIKMAIEAGFNPVNCTGSNVPLFEKFATLIIQECANIALREEHDPYECILKHFGVTNAI